MKINYVDGMFEIETDGLRFSVTENLFVDANGEAIQARYRGKDRESLKEACKSVYRECDRLMNVLDTLRRRQNEKDMVHY